MPDTTQEIVDHIFTVLGGATAIANGTGNAVQTVHDWLRKEPAEIPPWRRPAVLSFAKDSNKLDELNGAAREYLASTERMVGKAAA